MMIASADAVRMTAVSVVALIGLGVCVAWLPAWRSNPEGLPARLFIAAGVASAIADLGGVGSLLGIALALLGVLAWWEARPAPEQPRPQLLGLTVAALATGLATFAVLKGWGPLDRMPDEVRAVAALGVGAAGVLGTFAVADRSRVRLREATRRRFDPYDGLPEALDDPA